MGTTAAAGTNTPAAAVSLGGADLVSERPELLQRNGSRFALSGVHVSRAGGELGALLAEEDEARGDEYDTQRTDDDGSDRSLQGCGEQLRARVLTRTVLPVVPARSHSGSRFRGKYTLQIPAYDWGVVVRRCSRLKRSLVTPPLGFRTKALARSEWMLSRLHA